MVKSLVLAAALAATAGAQSPDLDAASRAALGAWRLSDVGGKLACTLSLTADPLPPGRAVKVPFACRRAFPPLKTLAAWTLDAQGSLVFADAAGAKIVAFPQPAGAAVEARAPDGKTWRLEPVRTPRTLSARDRMTGPFRLTSAGGAVLCDMSLSANLFGNAGSVEAGPCAPAWSEKGFALWTIRSGRLVLMDKTRKPLLVFKTQEPGAFVSVDPKAEVLTLARR